MGTEKRGDSWKITQGQDLFSYIKIGDNDKTLCTTVWQFSDPADKQTGNVKAEREHKKQNAREG